MREDVFLKTVQREMDRRGISRGRWGYSLKPLQITVLTGQERHTIELGRAFDSNTVSRAIANALGRVPE